MIGIRELKHLARRAWLARQPRALILMYHRVAEVPMDPQLLCVTPYHFEKHLEYLSKQYYPLSLQELTGALVDDRFTHKAVVLTFDDGYVDNLLNAKLLLEQYEIPATVFVTTGYIGKNSEFWWDELERLLLLPEILPDALTLTISGKAYSWDFGSRYYAKNTLPNMMWDVPKGFHPTPRHKAYVELHRLISPLDDKERQELLAELSRWAEAGLSARRGCRALNREELQALDNSGLVEIGSHTITHPVLSAQPLEVQRREITESKRYLENILERPIKSFAYSYGSMTYIGENAISLVREVGYEVACANFPALVTRRSDPYWLPRYIVRDWDGDEFARRLRGWFNG